MKLSLSLPAGLRGRPTSLNSDPQRALARDEVNVAAVRQLLVAAFTDRELRRFCQDRSDLRPVLLTVSSHAGIADLADALIEHCQKRRLFPELLAAVQEANPRQYEAFAGELAAPDTGRAGERAGLRPRPLPRRAIYAALAVGLVAAALLLGLRWLHAFRQDRARALTAEATALLLTSPDEARTLLLKAVDDDPRYGEAYVQLGDVYRLDGDAQQAAAAYEAALSLAPNDPVANRKLGLLLAAQGNDPGALEHLERAVRHDPGDAVAHNALGRLYIRLTRWAEARVVLATATALDPDLAVAHKHLGQVEQHDGDLAQAVREYLIAIELDGDSLDVETWSLLAGAYAEQGDTVRACETLGRFDEQAGPDAATADLQQELGCPAAARP